ncbi:MAG: hypothetical protein PVF58_16935 [Candidatus Methanofastidiosia archaeon]
MASMDDDTNGKAKENAAVLVICFFIIIGIIFARNYIGTLAAHVASGSTGFLCGFKIGYSV